MDYLLIGFAIIFAFMYTAYRLRTTRRKTQQMRFFEDDTDKYLENISDEYVETLNAKVRAARLEELSNKQS